MFSLFARSFAVAGALLLAPAVGFSPPSSPGRRQSSLTTTCSRSRRDIATFLPAKNEYDWISRQTSSEKRGRLSRESRKIRKNGRRIAIVAAALLVGAVGLPSPSYATGLLSRIPSPNDLKSALVSVLDGLAASGTKGMAVYTLLFVLWTMTVGVTTPIETAAGMAFPISKSIPLSAAGKIGGAFFQYSLAKYLFSDYAREKMKDNEWMDKINASFKSHPYRVALIWRFSPLPEFVKNVGPSLVPTLRTRYQVLAILTHGLPFTVLWSFMGAEAAAVARGGQASVFLKRMVAFISWVGLFVSPTLFGWWLKGLGESSDKNDDVK